ncbi:MAG: cobalt-precorrin-3B C(17)-methyltransferase, partial [Methanobrevibacter sp.]|nr:cobalt-precorrin-3B C(17)-methyltransferase [Methanobrevibacter sp.]
ISDILDGKEVIKKGMGDEISRVELGIAKALEGKNVALISSGDPGIFGMANVLFQIVSKYDDLEIKVYPGVTSATFSASLLGAPLHDFAAISLSDILTPLSEIERKIRHAAIADLVLVIYNPISKSRKKPFRLFKKILLETINSETLIGIVDSTYTPSKITITTLKDLNEEDINMSTTLVVGNSMTYKFKFPTDSNDFDDSNNRDYMVSPRGYVVKSKIHPMAKEFYNKFLNGEGSILSNKACEFYPCHNGENHQCDFCFCPFYPCGDGSTGGKWIKSKDTNTDIWSCEDCSWVHDKKTVEWLKPKIEEVLDEIDDLKSKKKDLLKIRRECIYHTKR